MRKMFVLLNVLQNEKSKKKILVCIGVILAPFALILCLLFSLTDAVTQHNNEVIETVFNQAQIPSSVPNDFKQYLLDMQNDFKQIDIAVMDVQNKIKEGSLDIIQVKSFFFAIYFGREHINLTSEQLRDFVNCFVESKRVAASSETKTDKDGSANEEIEPEEVLFVNTDIQKVAEKVSYVIGEKITDEQMRNYEIIYSMVNLGSDASTAGDGDYMRNLLKNAIEASESKPYVGGTVGSPFEDDWRNKITSEFGARSPVSLPNGMVISEAHTGMDLGRGVHLGTPILAVNDGTVVYVRNHTKGLGLHLAVDHGGGVITVYGHTSRILVKEGDTVRKGQKIAEVGSTGYSTGSHLHLEYWLHGQCRNPREYLE